MLRTQLFRIYGRDCCSFPTASLNVSRVGKHITDSGRAFHGTMPSGKKGTYRIFWKSGPSGKSLSGNNKTHEGWAGCNPV